MGTLSRAMEQERWELAAYCVLVAVVRLAARVPEESLAELLGLLVEDDRDSTE